MSEIVTNKKRVGRFTSSEIYRLTKMNRKGDGFGAPALTYIEEKRIEKRMGRSLSTDAYSQSIAWGNFMEQRVFDLIGLEYNMRSDETIEHPQIKDWAGSPDLIVPGVKVSDIKCYGLKNFAEYAEAIESQDIERIRQDFSKEYWQLVSNAIINQTPNAEAILYAPYKSELADIQEMAASYDGLDQWKYRFIYEREWWQLNVLPDDSGYKNLNIFEFEVPQEDVDFLTDRVKEAIELRDNG